MACAIHTPLLKNRTPVLVFVDGARVRPSGRFASAKALKIVGTIRLQPPIGAGNCAIITLPSGMMVGAPARIAFHRTAFH